MMRFAEKRMALLYDRIPRDIKKNEFHVTRTKYSSVLIEVDPKGLERSSSGHRYGKEDSIFPGIYNFHLIEHPYLTLAESQTF